MKSSALVTVNERQYRWPKRPVVVICVDGCERDYLTAAIAAGLMPYTGSLAANGADLSADCVIPAFTNPNNISIITGVPPRVHGICGNFFLNPATGEEVMMNEPRFLRAPTILSAFQSHGAKIAVVTAKDKLRRLLGHGLNFVDGGAVCFSAEYADQTKQEDHGIDNAAQWLNRPVPEVYSAELSEFVLASGVKLLAEQKPDLMYLSTTDYVQHKHAPGTVTANQFYAMLDSYLGQLADLGAVLLVTADHGMQAKHNIDGSPNIIFLQSMLDEALGAAGCRVILPITDPYVAHHGALGSFATVYCADPEQVNNALRLLQDVTGIDIVLTRNAACERFELPEDRLGDLVVIADANTVLGSTPARHDLGLLKEPLRSHGGLSEQVVPFLVSHVPRLDATRRLRNFDAFDVALNCITV